MISPTVLMLGFVAGATIFLGLPVARIKATRGKVRGFLNSVALGILLFLLVEVVEHGWEPIEAAVLNAGAVTGDAAVLFVLFAGGLALGLLGLVWFENRYITAAAKRMTREGEDHRGTTLALMIATGIGLHNFSEGLAIGASAASGALTFALVLAIGFALHNATEGFGIAAPLVDTDASWGFLALAGLIGGGPTFVGTVLGSVYTNELLNVLFLGLAAGALLYVIKELFFVGRHYTRGTGAILVTSGIVLGLLLGLLTDLVVTIGGA